MIPIDLSSLPVGKILARNIYDNSGRLLLPKDVILKPSHLQHLFSLDHSVIYVLGDSDADNVEALSQPADSPEQTLLPLAFSKAVERFRRLMCNVVEGHIIKRSEVEDTIDLIYPEVLRTNNIFRCLQNLRHKDDYTFQHSVSVCVIAVKIGQTLEMSEAQLRSLGVAGLMHDVGKAMISQDILLKPAPLSADECLEIQKHPLYGSQIVKDIKFSDPNIVTAVLQHHEYENGSGYPLHLSGEYIHSFSRIIAVADVFDAITSERYYRPRFPLLQAMEEITGETAGHLDPVITRRLLKYILNIIPGEIVRLSTGESARVIMANEREPMRPLVKTTERFIDLSAERGISIENRV